MNRKFFFLILFLFLPGNCTWGQISENKVFPTEFTPMLASLSPSLEPTEMVTEEPKEFEKFRDTIKKQNEKLRELNFKLKSLEEALRKRVEDDIRRDEREKHRSLTEEQETEPYVERPEDWRETTGLDEKEIEKLSDAKLIELENSLKMPRALHHPSLSRTTREIFDKMIESRVKILTAKTLQPFGQDFFTKGEDIRATLDQVQVPSTYVLGPGDGFRIRVWSDLGEESVSNVTINPEGQVYIPTLGVIGAQGLTLGQFEESVSRSLEEKFKHFKSQITLTKVRKIQVFVTGEAVRPGAQMLAAQATVFNSLYRAGGPTEKGSMRKIKIIRNGQILSQIDLYRYFLAGDKEQDIILENGDTVFIPPVGKRVKVFGEVIRPAIYELDGEKSLEEIIKMAGGLEPSAYIKRIKVFRWQGDRRRQILDAEGLKDADGKHFEIMNGDEIEVEKSLEQIGNRVNIEGAVKKPGEYAVEPGDSLSSLIEKAGGLIEEEASFHGGQIIRKSEKGHEEMIAFDPIKAIKKDPFNDHKIAPLDRVRVFFESEIVPDNRKVKIAGAVRRPGEYIFRDGMTIRDLILRAKGLTLEASQEAELARMLRGKEVEIQKVDLKQALKDAKAKENLRLQPMDQVTVFAEGMTSIEPEVVILKGEVKKPGPYALKRPGETLAEIIARAGGLTPEAFPEGTIFKRHINEIIDADHLKYAQAIQNDLYKKAEFDLRADLIRSGGKLSDIVPEEIGIIQATESWRFEEEQEEQIPEEENEKIEETDQKFFEKTKKKNTPKTARTFSTSLPSRTISEKTARIPVNLPLILQGKSSEANVTLKNGDQIYIPRVPSTIAVIGAVINPSNVLFKPNQGVKYYIDRVGGFAEHSKHSRTVIVKANGEVFPLRRVKKIDRGDIILVPPRPQLLDRKREIREKNIQQAMQVAQTLANLAVSYKVLLK